MRYELKSYQKETSLISTKSSNCKMNFDKGTDSNMITNNIRFPTPEEVTFINPFKFLTTEDVQG